MEPYYSCGIALDHSKPETKFLSREIKGIFEIEKWHTVNQVSNWSSEAITSYSNQHVFSFHPLGDVLKVSKSSITTGWMIDYIRCYE